MSRPLSVVVPRLSCGLALCALILSGARAHGQTGDDAPPPPAMLLPDAPPMVTAPFAAMRVEQRTRMRIGDITSIEGQRTNTVDGLGLVMGLQNTGGKSPVTRELLGQFLQSRGQRLDATVRQNLRTDTQLNTASCSAVAVQGEMPVDAKGGTTFEVTVTVTDGATSLYGGELVAVHLRGQDEQVYAVAKGKVSVGYSFTGNAASVQKGHTTTGRATATVEVPVLTNLAARGQFNLVLRGIPDFNTTTSIAEAINRFQPGVARAMSASEVQVLVPSSFRNRVPDYVALLNDIPVATSTRARVVISELTGTIVIAGDVRISSAAISHGNLVVTRSETPVVSQPAPLSNGQTTVVPRTQISVQDEGGPLQLLNNTYSLAELVDALNALGLGPRDLSEILQQLRNSGALQAEIVLE